MRALASLALVAAGCRGVLGIPAEAEVQTIAIGVAVHGTNAATDAPVTIYLDDSISHERQQLAADADGVLMFPRALENGAEWTVTASPGCEVHGGSGVLAGVAIVVEVACDGYLALVEFGFSAPVETVATGASFQTFGSLLTQHTTVEPVTAYPLPDVTATAYHDGVAIPSTGLDMSDGDDVDVVVAAPGALPQLVQRSYATELSLAGLPAEFAVVPPLQASAGGHHGHALDAYDRYLLVGTPDAGDGRAVLYTRRGRVWTQDHVFDAPAANSSFGASVAVGEGYVVIGAPDIGSAYLYRHDVTGWQLAAQVDATAATRTGASVAIEKSPSPSYFVVGAPGTSSGRGMASVYDLTGSLHATCAAPAADAAAGDELGASVAISNDHVVIAGAPGDSSTSRAVVDEGYPASGAAYVFDATAGGTPTAVKIKPALVGAGDRFGTAVAIAATGGLVAIGAPLESSGTTPGDNARAAAGAVYVFSGGASYPTELFVKAPTPDTGDNFGDAVALRAAAGAQTEHVLVVGAPYEDSALDGVSGAGDPDNDASDAGAVYAIALDAAATSATLAAYVKSSDTSAGDHFGSAVALTPESLVVGAPGADAQVGAVYAYR